MLAGGGWRGGQAAESGSIYNLPLHPPLPAGPRTTGAGVVPVVGSRGRAGAHAEAPEMRQVCLEAEGSPAEGCGKEGALEHQRWTWRGRRPDKEAEEDPEPALKVRWEGKRAGIRGEGPQGAEKGGIWGARSQAQTQVWSHCPQRAPWARIWVTLGAQAPSPLQ